MAIRIMGNFDDDLEAEIAKYEKVYSQWPNYRMGPHRRRDAQADLRWFRSNNSGVKTMLDVGCGRGEMIKMGRACGFEARGMEAVTQLCDQDIILEGRLPDMVPYGDKSFDLVTCMDVLEHLPIGVEVLAIKKLHDLARRWVLITANNKSSICPVSGDQMHINIRSYDEWEQLLKDEFGSEAVTRIDGDGRYVSAAWRCRCD